MKKAFTGVLFMVALVLATSFVVQARTPKKVQDTRGAGKGSQDLPRTGAERRSEKGARQELEKEHGKLVYSYDIRATGRKDVTEVQVNARDGAIIGVGRENAAHEAKEHLQDLEKR